MRELFLITWWSLATAALVCLAICTWMVQRADSPLLFRAMQPRPGFTFRESCFLSLAALGFAVCMFKGAEAMLGWIPASWGRYEEGEWTPFAFTIAAVFTVAAGGQLAFALGATTIESVHSRVHALRTEYLEKLLAASFSEDRLDAVKFQLECERKQLAKASSERGESPTRDLKLLHCDSLIRLAERQQERLRASKDAAVS